jgi:hypothetical protein
MRSMESLYLAWYALEVVSRPTASSVSDPRGVFGPMHNTMKKLYRAVAIGESDEKILNPIVNRLHRRCGEAMTVLTDYDNVVSASRALERRLLDAHGRPVPKPAYDPHIGLLIGGYVGLGHIKRKGEEGDEDDAGPGWARSARDNK